jgi:hypothetical protein
MKDAGAITLRGSHKTAQGGYDPIASGLSQIAICGRPFLSEWANDKPVRYYKGGLAWPVLFLMWSALDPRVTHHCAHHGGLRVDRAF